MPPYLISERYYAIIFYILFRLSHRKKRCVQIRCFLPISRIESCDEPAAVNGVDNSVPPIAAYIIITGKISVFSRIGKPIGGTDHAGGSEKRKRQAFAEEHFFRLDFQTFFLHIKQKPGFYAVKTSGRREDAAFLTLQNNPLAVCAENKEGSFFITQRPGHPERLGAASEQSEKTVFLFPIPGYRFSNSTPRQSQTAFDVISKPFFVLETKKFPFFFRMETTLLSS